MLQLMFRKIWNKKWMLLCLLIGNILLVAVAAGTPMYTQAVLSRVLTRELGNYIIKNNRYPTMLQADKTVGSVNVARGIMPKLEQTGELLEQIPERLSLKVLEKNYGYYVTSYNATPLVQRSDDFKRKEVRLGSFLNFNEHISLIAGEMYSDTVEDGIIEVAVSRKTFSDENLILGEELLLNDIKASSGNPYIIRITGVYDSLSPEDPYWTENPNNYAKRYIMANRAFQELFGGFGDPRYAVSREWALILDYTGIRPQDAAALIENAKLVKMELETLTEQECDLPFIAILEDYLVKEKKLSATLDILQVPIYILLGIYIYMVSRQMIDMETSEIAFFRSRGGSKSQIIRLYLLQSFLITGLSLLTGMPLGILFCRLIGNTNSFLEFVGRTALDVSLNKKAVLYSGFGMVFSIIVMAGQAWKNTSASIVMQKRDKSRGRISQLWRKAFFDIIVLGISLYGLYNYHSQRELLTKRIVQGSAMDPLLYLSSVLFIIGSTLAALRFFPVLIKAIFLIMRKWCGAVVYTTFRQILQTQHRQGFILLFLVLTVSIGIFNANTARTINSNEDNKIRYLTGADLVVQERWNTVSAYVPASEDGSAGMAGTFITTETEADYEEYKTLAEVLSLTKVFTDNQVKVLQADNSSIDNITLMGIHTREFGETVDFQEGLTSGHWYHSLNAMSQKQDGVLVSRNFADIRGYKQGDMLEYQDSRYGRVQGVICGFVDYWPSYVPVINEMQADGTLTESPQYLIVAHLSLIQSSWGILPYQIWMKLSGSSGFFYEFAEAHDKKYTFFADVYSRLLDKNNDPVFQGTNGILTLGFLIVLMLCAAGFLIYWITSIRSRTLQFGIYCAMGMSRKEVLGMLFMEQVFLSGVPVAFGLLTGFLVSKLYIPLIQVSYVSGEQVIPLKIIQESSDIIRILLSAMIMIGSGMLILGVLVSGLKVTQALKLGED